MATTRLETRLTARDETARAFRTLQGSLNTVNAAFSRVAKVAAGLGVVFGGLFVRDLISVNREFQSLKASLITFTGSVENADGAFRILRDFASKTPFSLQEVVTSFNILVSRGIRPTEEQLSSFADIAGGTSKSIEQFAEAVADASVGEFERLKEFGIRASKEGNKLTLSMGDYTKTINNDSASILAALQEIGQLKFAGGAIRQAETLGGSITNLRDSFDAFLYAIGEAGFAGELSKAVRILTSMISGNDDLAKSISNRLNTALYAAVAAIRFVVDNLDTLLMAFKVAFAVAVISRILTVGKAFIDFGKAVAKSQLAVTVFSAIMQKVSTRMKLGAAGFLLSTAALIEFSDEIRGFLGDLVDTIDLTGALDRVFGTLGLSTESLESRFNELASELDGTDTEFVKNNNSILDFLPTMDGAGSSISNTTDAASELRRALDDIKKTIDPVGVALKGLAAENTLLKRAVADGTMTQEDAISVLNRLTRQALGLDDTMGELQDQQLKVEAAFKAGVISGAEYEKAISDIRSGIIDYRAETEKTFGAGAIRGIKNYYQSISDNAANATDFVSDAFGSLESSLSDFFYTGKFDFQTFTNAIKKGLADLAAKAVVTVGLNFLGKIFPGLQFADGGLVPGSGGPRADDVLARVSSGEYVIKASSVSKFGSGFFDAINAGQMPNTGGGGFSIDAGVMEGVTQGFGFGGFLKDLWEGITNTIKNILNGIFNTIKNIVGAITNAVKGLVSAIMSGDILSIAAFALPFILPGVGSAIAGNLAAGSGLIGSISGGISSAFAGGILGAGNLSAIATSVGIEFAKGAVIDGLTEAITTQVLKITGNMALSGGAYEADRSERFGKLYSDAAPYLAGMTGSRFNAGDNVRVGERGEELLIPGRNGMVAPIKGSANDLIDVVKDMKEEIVLLRRQMSRVIAGGQLVGARS